VAESDGKSTHTFAYAVVLVVHHSNRKLPAIFRHEHFPENVEFWIFLARIFASKGTNLPLNSVLGAAWIMLHTPSLTPGSGSLVLARISRSVPPQSNNLSLTSYPTIRTSQLKVHNKALKALTVRYVYPHLSISYVKSAPAIRNRQTGTYDVFHFYPRSLQLPLFDQRSNVPSRLFSQRFLFLLYHPKTLDR
jgi:hypothetical protein